MRWIVLTLSVTTLTISMACVATLEDFYHDLNQPGSQTSSQMSYTSPSSSTTAGSGQTITGDSMTTPSTDTTPTSNTANSVSSGAVLYDYLPPQIVIDSLEDGDWTPKDVTVSGTALDNVGIDKIRVKLDGENWVTASGTDTWSYTFEDVSVGFHTAKIEAQDLSGNTDTDLVYFNVDNTAPTVTIDYPAESSHFGEVLSMGGTANDNAESGVALVEISIDGGDWEAVTGTTSWTYVWDARTMPEASYTFDLRATDVIGLVSTTVSRSVTKTQWNQTGGPLNLDPSYDAVRPDVAFYNGYPYVAHREFDGFYYQIRVQKWDGSAWQSLGGTLNTDPTKNADFPKIDITDDGTVYVVWHEHNGSNNRVHSAKWDGSVWTSIGMLNRNGGREALYPNIAIQNGTTPFVTWQERDSTWNHERVYAKYYDGSSWQWCGPNDATGIRHSTNWNIYNYTPDIAFDEGTAYIIQRELEGNHRLYLMEHQGGTTWSRIGGAISDSGSYPQYDFTLAIINSHFYVSFRQSDGSYDQLYVHKYDGAWSQLGSVLNEDTGRNAQRPSIAFKDTTPADERLYVAFVEEVALTNLLYFKRWNGSAWELVSTENANPNAGVSCTSPRLYFYSGNPYIALQEQSSPQNAYLRYYNLP